MSPQWLSIKVLPLQCIITSAMASQITSLMIVYLIVYSRRRPNNTSKLCVTGLCEGNSLVTCEFPTQRGSDVENISIWWRHHALKQSSMALVMTPLMSFEFCISMCAFLIKLNICNQDFCNSYLLLFIPHELILNRIYRLCNYIFPAISLSCNPFRCLVYWGRILIKMSPLSEEYL